MTKEEVLALIKEEVREWIRDEIRKLSIHISTEEYKGLDRIGVHLEHDGLWTSEDNCSL